MDERPVLLCMPTSKPAVVPSKVFQCETCGVDVWASPASLIAAGAKVRILCIPCGAVEIEKTPPSEWDLQGPTEAQLREITN